MAPTFAEIAEEFTRRKEAVHPAMERMREIRSIYEGEVVVPLPELEKSERAAVANLIQTGLDQLSMRVASVMPDVWYPPVQPGLKRSEQAARIRRRANLGWWDTNQMQLKLRKRARWLMGYATSPVMILPDPRWEMPRWHLRDPRGCFPPPGCDPEEITPPDCIFAVRRSLAWLRTHYPQAVAGLYTGSDAKPSDMFEVVEYIDAEIHSLGIIGSPRQKWDYGVEHLSPQVEVRRIPNELGVCPVVVPSRINLDTPLGQFHNATGMYAWQARLQALELIAIEKSIFPETYLVSRPNEIAAFIDGPHDGRTGRVNVVKGGDIREITPQPNLQTNTAIDRMERNQRLTGGVPPEFGGESGSNIRTGRRGDAVLSAAIDFPVQEAQEIFEISLAAENRIAVAIVKRFFNRPKSFYVHAKGARGQVDYTPSVHFDSDVNFVRFAHAGADINSLTVGLGQLIGVGLLSRRSAMEMDPRIEDAEREHDRIIYEALEQSVLAALQQAATTGATPLVDLANIMDLVARDKVELVQAVQRAQQAAQERQATPAAPGAPEAQPGLGPPGMGAEQPSEGGEVSSLPALLAQLRGAPAATRVAG